MSYNLDGTRDLYSQTEFSSLSNEQEAEIAYFLQNCQPGDPDIIELLVRNYAEHVLWLIQLVLPERLGKKQSTSVAHSILVKTFAHAANNIDQFWGEASVRNWLYALAIHITRTKNRRLGIPFSPGYKDQFGEKAGKQVGSSRYKNTGTELLNEFPKKFRLVVLLRYVFHLEIRDIASILDVKEKRIHEWLTGFRSRIFIDDRLQVYIPLSAGLHYPDGETHKPINSLIHANIDGLLEKNSEEDILLRDHLLVCEKCRAYASALDDLVGQLENILKYIVPRQELSNAQVVQLIQSVEEDLSLSKRSIRIEGPLRKLISTTLITILIASGVYVLIRTTPERGEFPAASTPTERILPTPIGPNKSIIFDEHPEENFSITFFAMQPTISADGRWIVFASNVSSPEVGEVQDTFDIMIYDTRAQSLERIGSQVLPLDKSLFASPDISGDGRWVVYSGYGETLDDGYEPCQTNDNSNCVDIILYDRQNHQHKRITHSALGGPSNGDSILPSISVSGQWITFWSFASNLVEGDPEPCDDGRVDSCAELYVYDLINDKTELIPIGRLSPPDREPENVLRGINISSDGRWLLLPILGSDRIADQAGLESGRNLYLYDREERSFEPINATPEETTGTFMSFSGSMTPDGNYVVFQSASGDLVLGDENDFNDVFLFDHSNGRIEMISQAPDGTPADGDSGNITGLLGNIAITNDGRYVAFASSAGNLDPGSPGYCKSSENNSCISIYVHDRLTSDMENIATPQDDTIYLNPTISDDGRWISYMEVSFDCVNTNEFCVDLNLYDRDRGWTSQVTRNLFPRDDIPWELETIFETTNSNITGIEFSPDGESIALLSNGRYVEIIDAFYGENLATLQGVSDAAILKVSFSPDGKYIAGGASDGTVNIWRIADGSLAYILDEHPGRIRDIQFSVDGELLYVTTSRAVWIWHRTERKFTRENFLEYADVTIQDIDISPSNELMVVVPTQDPSIWIQRLPRGDVIHRLTGYGSNVSSASFSPDGNYLIAQFNNGLVQVWQLEIDALGSIIPILVNEKFLLDPFGKIDLSPDSAFVAVGSLHDGVHLWEIGNNRSLIIPDSNNMRLASGVVFSPNGDMLAASSLGGGVYIWSNTTAPDDIELFSITFTDEFIQIPNRRRPIQDAAAHLDLDRRTFEGLTLYEADDHVSFDVFAPFRLPANIIFDESSIMQDGGVLVQYRVDDRLSGQPIADLYFRQRLISRPIPPIRVGESAIVENIQFNGRRAEYVKGDWLSIPAQQSHSSDTQDLQNIHWTWSSASNVQQMRWQHLTQVFSLSYIPRSSGEQQIQLSTSDPGTRLYQRIHLTKYDLVEIASGFSNLNRSAASDRIFTNYTVKPGDTCTSIAFQYDTTVSTLARLNRLAGECELIVEGQTLLVPLPNERLPLTEVDLDCDGKLERLRLVPTPLYVDTNISYGIILEALSDIGLYEKRWQYTVADVNAEYIARPQLLPISSCQQMIALNVMGFTEENVSGLRVFAWDAESMKLIFTADGWLQSVTPLESGVSISTLEREYLPGTSTCNRTIVNYTWDGSVFNETTRFIDEATSCGLR